MGVFQGPEHYLERTAPPPPTLPRFAGEGVFACDGVAPSTAGGKHFWRWQFGYRVGPGATVGRALTAHVPRRSRRTEGCIRLPCL